MEELSAQERKHLVRFRLAEAMREIGVLLLVFAPLDFIFDLRPIGVTGPVVIEAIVVAVLLFALGVIAESRIYGAD